MVIGAIISSNAQAPKFIWQEFFFRKLYWYAWQIESKQGQMLLAFGQSFQPGKWRQCHANERRDE